MNSGWIKLHRKILDNPISSRPTWAWLWVILLLLANHDGEHIFIWDGKTVSLKKGQFVTGRKKLNEISGIPESTIEDILNYLESQHQIRQQKTTKYRLITILKWEDYQSSDIKSDNRATTERHIQEAKELKNTNIVANAPEWKFDIEVDKLRNSNTKSWKIIALYYTFCGIRFENKEQYIADFKRQLKACMPLKGYTGAQILQTMEFCKKEFPDKWVLETVGKRIASVVNNKK